MDEVTTQATDVEALFQPLTIGSRIIPNRIVMSPMTRAFVDAHGVVPEASVEYYRRRAAGGAGMIITEGIAVNADGALASYAPLLDTRAAVDVWTRIVRAVQGEGGVIVAQLWHGGLLRGTQGAASERGRRIGPSAVYPLPGGGVHAQGEAMSADDIAYTIADCVRFAVLAREIGFDGVEIHGAHGYLFDQFFWRKVNRRTDAYGGSVANRARFTAETVRAIRAETGADFIIGLRMSQWKNPPDHYGARMVDSADELGALLTPLVEAGVDFFDCSTRRYWEPAFTGSARTLAEWTQALSGRPTMAVGSVTVTSPLNTGDVGETAAIADNLAPVAELIRDGRVAMVGVGRAMIANADWAAQVRTGDLSGLKPYSADALAVLD